MMAKTTAPQSELDQVAARLSAERAGEEAKGTLADVKRDAAVAEAQGLTVEALAQMTPEQLVPGLELLFGKLTNPMVAKFAGPELRLDPSEVRQLAEAWAPAAALYAPNIAALLTHPLFVAVGGTVAIYSMKMEAAEKAKAHATQAPGAGGGPPSAPGPDGR
jgi:hypothetical protein